MGLNPIWVNFFPKLLLLQGKCCQHILYWKVSAIEKQLAAYGDNEQAGDRPHQTRNKKAKTVPECDL